MVCVCTCWCALLYHFWVNVSLVCVCVCMCACMFACIILPLFVWIWDGRAGECQLWVVCECMYMCVCVSAYVCVCVCLWTCLTLSLCGQLSKPAEQKGGSCGDSVNNAGVKPHPCKPRPVFLPSLSTSSINSDSSTELQGLTDVEVKKNMTGGGGGESEPTGNHDTGLLPSGTGVTVTAAPVAPRSHSAISVENLTLSSSSSSNNGECRLGQESAFTSSENLFAPLCNSSHGLAGGSGVFGGVAASGVSVSASQPASSAYENCFPGSGSGSNSTVGAIGLSGLLSAPLASHTPLSGVHEPETTTTAKRQRSKWETAFWLLI